MTGLGIVLRNGDWVGDSAEVFYAEMDSVVMPALDQAAQTELDRG